MTEDVPVIVICLIFPFIGLFFSLYYAHQTSKIEIDPSKPGVRKINSYGSKDDRLLDHETAGTEHDPDKLFFIYGRIYDGAHAFLYAEYKYISVFIVLFSILIIVVLGATDSWVNAVFTAIAFIVGCGTSVLAGLIGMKIGVYANARVAIAAQNSLEDAFAVSFKAAIVMGFTLCSMGLLNLFVLIYLFRLYYSDAFDQQKPTTELFEAIAGYGLGGSCIGMFGRVGGGIYTKAADVGADLVGKVESGLPEDDPRNPAVIADNVGDNVGDIAGMGADLFGSFAEASCAALVIGAQGDLWKKWLHLAYPLTISAGGLFVCFLTSFAATHLVRVNEVFKIERTLKHQLLISTILMTPVLFGLSVWFLPSTIGSIGGNSDVKDWHVFFCGASGLWSGLAIGYITEYYTSHSYTPVREVSQSCAEGGAATNIIYGLALGYLSVIVPVICLVLTSYIAHYLAGFYGVAIAALGILSTLSIGLTIDAFGPICDNAGGIAEMCELGHEVRERTDALDAAGNTTAAIGKGFAIGSAALVSLALFSGFVVVTGDAFMTNGELTVNILSPFPFSGLLFGAMLPYWFTALTMKSVGRAANAMVRECRRQFAENPNIILRGDDPDYDACISISTEASLKEMIAPGMLVIMSPILVGFIFGLEALAGMLIGGLVSGVQMAISQSNTGGAWDNAKKYIGQGQLTYEDSDGNIIAYTKTSKEGKPVYDAAVVGDTVGDPLKDTSGPSINILMKLMAIISLVFGRAFPKNNGGGLGKLFSL